MFKKFNIIGFILLFLASVCIMPATHQGIGPKEDLRAAVILAKKLSNQADAINSNFSNTFTETISALRRLSILELTLTKEDTSNDSPVGTIVLSPRLSYLTNCNNSYLYTFFSYDINYVGKNKIYTSILLSPDVPPPEYS